MQPCQLRLTFCSFSFQHPQKCAEKTSVEKYLTVRYDTSGFNILINLLQKVKVYIQPCIIQNNLYDFINLNSLFMNGFLRRLTCEERVLCYKLENDLHYDTIGYNTIILHVK